MKTLEFVTLTKVRLILALFCCRLTNFQYSTNLILLYGRVFLFERARVGLGGRESDGF